MASFLDITLLGGIHVIFLWLLVYVVVWGLLTMVKPFGSKAPTGPYALIALVAATLAVTSTTLKTLVEFITPWFVFLILFLFFLMFLLRMFGLGDKDMSKIIKEGTVYSSLLVVVVIITLFGLGEAFGQRSLEATNAQQQAPPQQGGMPVIGPEDGGAPPGQPTGGQYSGGGGLQGYDQQGYGQPQPGQVGATDTGDFSLNFINTLFHPKILGIIAMILIAFVTVWLLGRPQIVK